MRQVRLDGSSGRCEDASQREKLAGHLKARLAEYEQEGLHPSVTGPGQVCVRMDGVPAGRAVERLGRRGISALEDGDAVRFQIGPDVSFEDLDYVQGELAALLDL